jgi:site-specific recombinase XerD
VGSGAAVSAMLTIYRRHSKVCPQRNEPHYRDHIDGDVFARKTLKNNCRCIIHVDGLPGDHRKTLSTQNWEKAKSQVLAWDRGERSSAEGKIPIKEATEVYIADAEDRNLDEKTIYKYRYLFAQLKAFADLQGIRFLKELDVATLRKFRTGWKDQNYAALKKLERLRSFFRFCLENGWVAENPAKKLGNPKCENRETLPYDDDEMFRILAAADEKIRSVQPHGRDNALRLRALVLLLRYSGLRISDAVGCPVDRLVSGKLKLRTQKTGTDVYIPLHDSVALELDAIPQKSERYWFWTGNGKLQSAVADWQGRLKDLFDDAKIQKGHAHRFRDTFATKLLQEGVPIERVSIFLGHQSVKITEKYYRPWVRERQEQAEADVRRTWERDRFIALSSVRGTSGVHETKGPVN